MRRPDRFQAGRTVAAIAALCLAGLLAVRPVAAEELQLTAYRNLALQMVNASRREHNLPPLVPESKLDAAAQAHAADMLKRSYFAHDSPEGKNVGDRYEAAGGSTFRLTAENIAKCQGCKPPITEADLRMIHDGWMKSPGHRENILRKGLTAFGFGLAANANGGLYAVQTFSGPGVQKDEATGAAAGKPFPPQAQAKAALAEINERRKKAGKRPLELDDGLGKAASVVAQKTGENESASAGSEDIRAMLPIGEQADWRSMTIIAGTCGGCGAETVPADIGYFIQEWLTDKTYANMLLDAEATHLGFAVHANGKGLKAAVGIVGR
jgi:uncharacterized protein YkwD